jgi:isopentenyldiphosphate isomerase
MTDSFLDVVDENDVVIGRERRSVIHKNGLRHREIGVWFMTPQAELIFQQRSMTKQTWPGFLDAAVGGNVESGDDYETTALKETLEETGLDLRIEDLHFFGKEYDELHDPNTGMQNNCFRGLYGYVLREPLSALKIEPGEGEGFVTIHLDDVIARHPEKCAKLIPDLLREEMDELYKKLRELI